MPFSEIFPFARGLGRRRADIASPEHAPPRPMTWAAFQLDNGVEVCVPMVAVTVGTDYHAAFLNLPNFVAGVSGGIETLASIAFRERPQGSRRITFWEAELHHWGGGVIARSVTFSGHDNGVFWGPKWRTPGVPPRELLDEIGQTYFDLVAVGVLKHEEIAHGFA